MMQFQYIFTALACVLISAPTMALDLLKEPQTIKLDRSYRVGMQTKEVILISNATRYQIGKTDPQVTQQDFKLTCGITVLALDNRHWQQIELTVSAIAFPRQGKDRMFNAINSPILATRDNDGVTFKRRDETALTDLEVSLLKRFFVPPTSVSPDDLFGTSDTQTTGSSWSVDSEALSKQLAAVTKESIRCKPENTSGKMTFLRLWTHKDQTYQQVGGAVTYSPVSLHGAQFAGLTGTTGRASLTVSYQLPVDTTLPAAKMNETFKLSITGKQGAGANPTTVTIETAAKKTRQLTIIKPGKPSD